MPDIVPVSDTLIFLLCEKWLCPHDVGRYSNVSGPKLTGYTPVMFYDEFSANKWITEHNNDDPQTRYRIGLTLKVAENGQIGIVNGENDNVGG